MEKSVLYSNGKFELVSNMSSFFGDRVFSGQAWDDFCIVGLLTKPGAKILVLGMSHGALVRPILASNPTAKITGVEIDFRTYKNCIETYSKYFPEICINVINDDAFSYVQKNSEKYDAIVIDLYDENGYVDFISNSIFHKSVNNLLNKGGVVFVNQYGLPIHLFNAKQETYENTIISFFNEKYNFVQQLPYRRNNILIASNCELKSEFKGSLDSLSMGDQCYIKNLQVRVNYLNKPQTKPYNTDTDTDTSYSSLNNTTKDEWRAFFRHFNERIKEITKITNVDDVISLINDKDLSIKILEENHSDEKIIMFYSSFLISESHNQDVNTEWFIDWVINTAKNKVPENLYHKHLLPQALSYLLSRSENNSYNKKFGELNYE